jgi:hypothetical protein
MHVMRRKPFVIGVRIMILIGISWFVHNWVVVDLELMYLWHLT